MNDAHTAQSKKIISPLKNRADFLRLNKSGQKWIAKNLIIQAAPRDAHTPDHSTDTDSAQNTIRVGITITKKIYKSAVKRNRIKRRLRALSKDIIADNGELTHDYVLIGRPSTLDAPYDTLKKDLSWCLRKLNLTRQKP